MGKAARSRAPRSSAARRTTPSASSRLISSEPAWFTVAQLCQRWQLGRKTIYKFIDTEVLPAWKVGIRLYRVAVADVLRLLASGGPVLIAIDDLQWIDMASRDALAFAFRRLSVEPVGLVLARRIEFATGLAPSEGDERGLGSAVDQQVRIEVGALTVGVLGRLLHERLGVAFPRPLLVRMHTACGGNPFLGLEMGRSLLARSAMPGPGEPFPVPPQAGPLVRRGGSRFLVSNWSR